MAEVATATFFPDLQYKDTLPNGELILEYAFDATGVDVTITNASEWYRFPGPFVARSNTRSWTFADPIWTVDEEGEVEFTVRGLVQSDDDAAVVQCGIRGVFTGGALASTDNPVLGNFSSWTSTAVTDPATHIREFKTGTLRFPASANDLDFEVSFSSDSAGDIVTVHELQLWMRRPNLVGGQHT